MSRNSKAKRDARIKNEPKRSIRRLGGSLQPHAQLLDADDAAVGGVGWRDNEWLLVLGGQVAARSESAALALAMLKHVVAVQARAGHTLDEYLSILEQERMERDPPSPMTAPSLRH